MSTILRQTRTLRWLPAFIVLSAIWGSSFSLIKIAVEDGVPPLWISFFRCALGAATLWMLLAARRNAVPVDSRLWLHAGVAAVLLNSVPFTLIAYGESRISSVLAGVLTATTPLFTLGLVILRMPNERPSHWRLGGLGLGLVGVLVVVDVAADTGTSQILGGAAVLGAAACYGAGYVYTRRFLSARPESGTVLSTVQITLATLQLGLVAPIAADLPSRPAPQTIAALVILGSLGTGFAYVLNFAVIRIAGPTVASTVTYAVPVWSTGLGGLLLAEDVGWNVVIGGVLVVSGVALSRHAPAPARLDPAPARADNPV